MLTPSARALWPFFVRFGPAPVVGARRAAAADGVLWSLSIPLIPSRPDRAVSAKTHGFFIQMTQSIFAQGRNSGCNSQMLSNLDETTVDIFSLYNSPWF